jgi:hypothetical protein
VRNFQSHNALQVPVTGTPYRAISSLANAFEELKPTQQADFIQGRRLAEAFNAE